MPLGNPAQAVPFFTMFELNPHQMIEWMRCISAILLFALLNSCANPKPVDRNEEVAILAESDSTAASGPREQQDYDPDQFLLRIDRASLLLSDWGFYKEQEVVFRTREDLSSHWWLTIFDRKSGMDTSHFPSVTDWQDIRQIRQFTFKKNWKYVVEEWQFSDQQAARSWLNVALNTRRLDDQKPPRIYWIEEDKMYFIMATAAYDWFEYSNELIRAFSGREVADIHLTNESP